MTLDGIAGQLSALTERVAEMFTAQADLTHRLAIVETAIAPTPTPTATATPTPDPDVPRLQFGDIEEDHDANRFAAWKKYGEYEGNIVEIEGDIENIGNNWDGRGFPYISIGYVPEVHCTLEEVEEDVLLEAVSNAYRSKGPTTTTELQLDPSSAHHNSYQLRRFALSLTLFKQALRT